QEGVLAESRTESASLKRGRPQIGLALNPDAAAVMTVVLSLNFLTAAVVDYTGQTVSQEQKKLDTLRASRADLIGECIAIVRRQLERRSAYAPGVRRIAQIGRAHV